MKIATAILLSVCLATVCAVALAFGTGGRLTPAFAWLALVCGAAAGLTYYITSGTAGARLRLGWPEWAAVVFFALFALRAFCWLIFTSGDSVMVLSPNNLGDMPLHLTYIRYLAKGAPFWPENPIFSGVSLHYPAGIDIFNALWSLAGCNDLRVLIWVGLAASAVTAYALLRWGGWFTVVGFLCNGGLAGWRYFHHFQFLLQDYQEPMAWKSIPLAMFVTQRGLLYAIPAGLLLLTTWRDRWFCDDEARAVRMPLWVQVVLYSTLPLFHLHTFIFLSALLGWWLIWGGIRHGALDLLLWALLPATVCVGFVTGLFQPTHGAAGVIHLKPGWMQENSGFFRFWFVNFGFLPILLAFWLALAWRRYSASPATRHAVAFVAPALLMFLVACVVMFAPWEWDNTKIMIWSYLVILPYLGAMLEEQAALSPFQGRVVQTVCCVSLFFSGFISLAGGLDRSHTGIEIAKRSELDAVNFAVRFLPAETTFVGYPTYNHPLLLCGCKMTEGYVGHLISHGIPYEARDAEVRALMEGAQNWRQIVQDLHIRYLFWGSREEDAYSGSTQPWKDKAPVAAAGPWGTLYEVGPTAPVVLGK